MDFDIETLKKLIKDFDSDAECEELQKAYLSVFSQVKSFELREELKKLERLLNQKNLFDMAYAYRVGVSYAKHVPNINIYAQPLDAVVNTNRLYNIDEYDEICQEIKKQEKALYDMADGYTQSIDFLFEIYSYYNYELIKFTFTAAYRVR